MNTDRFENDFDKIETITTKDKTIQTTMISEHLNVQMKEFTYGDHKPRKDDDMDFQLIVKKTNDNNIVRGYGFETYNEMGEKLSEILEEDEYKRGNK